MRRKELEQILGDAVISQLFSFVRNDSISKFNLRNMAEEIGVIQTYNAYKDRDPFNPVEVFSSMLDEEL